MKSQTQAVRIPAYTPDLTRSERHFYVHHESRSTDTSVSKPCQPSKKFGYCQHNQDYRQSVKSIASLCSAEPDYTAKVFFDSTLQSCDLYDDLPKDRSTLKLLAKSIGAHRQHNARD